MSRFRPRALGVLLATSSWALTSSASADETNVCTESYEHAQIEMKPRDGESSLLRARASLLTCMRSNCKDWMVADCSKWLSEVEARIPTVVFAARNTAGRDLTDVQVQKPNGEALAARLDGRAIELEPGQYTFVFVSPDGARVEKTALVREGEKAQSIVATFEASAEELAKARGQTGPIGPVSGGPERTEPNTIHYVGYGAAGIGVVGVALGGIFGLTAIQKKSTAGCDANGACDPDALSDARSAATVSTIGFVAGAALLAGGVVLVVLTPARSSVRVEARASGTAFGVGGAF